MHISASVFINDDESGLHHDFDIWLEKLAPEKPHSQYQHNGFEDNADAHLKRTIMVRGSRSSTGIVIYSSDYGLNNMMLHFVITNDNVLYLIFSM